MALKMSVQKRAVRKRAEWNNLPGNKHNIRLSADTGKEEDALRETSTSISFPLVKGVLRRN